MGLFGSSEPAPDEAVDQQDQQDTGTSAESQKPRLFQAPEPAPIESPDPSVDNVRPYNEQKYAMVMDMAKKDQIPALPSVIDAIMNDRVDPKEVVNRYAEFKIKNPNLTVNANGERVETKTASQVFDKIPTAGIPGLDSTSFSQSVESWIKRDKFAVSKLISGATFGMIDASEAPDDSFTTSMMGGLADFAGMTATSMVASPAIKAIPGVGGLVKGLEASAAASTGLLKVAKTAAAVAAEAAPLGFATGAARSLMHGNNVTESLEEGIIDAAGFAAAGAILTGAMSGVAKLFGSAKTARMNATAGQAAEAGKGLSEEMAAATETKSAAAAAPETAAPGASKAEDFYQNLQAKPRETLTPDESAAFDTLTKIRATQPLSGPGLVPELQNAPEVLKAYNKEQAKNLVDQAIQGPLADLYATNKDFKSLVDSNPIEALASMQGFYEEALKKNITLQQWTTSPLVSDANSVYEAVADKYMGRVDKVKYPGLSKTLIVDYLSDPSNTTLKGIYDAAGGKAEAETSGLGRRLFQADKVPDLRINPADASDIAAHALEASLKTLANGGNISIGDFGKIKDSDAIFNAAITANRDVHSTIIGAMKTVWGRWTEGFVHIDPELSGFVGDEVKIRTRSWEMKDLIKKRVEARNLVIDLTRQFKSAGDAEKNVIAESLKAARDANSDIAANMNTLTREINTSRSVLESLEPEKRSMVTNLVNDMYLPTKEMMGVRQSDFMQRFNFKENPYYVKKSSSLADYMNMLRVGGEKYDLPETKELFGGLGIVANIENIGRQVSRQLGPENPITAGIVPALKDAEAKASVYASKHMESIAEFKIRSGSKLDGVAKDLSEGKIAQSDKVFQDLTPDERSRVIGNIDAAKRITSQVVTDMNEVLRRNNLPEVNVREGYTVPNIADVSESLGTIIKGFMDGKKEIPLPFEGTKSINLQSLRRTGDPTKTYFGFEFQRTGSDYNLGLNESLDKYLLAASKRIFATDLLRQVDVARSFAPEGLAKVLDRIKDDHILNLPSAMDKDLNKAPILKAAIKFGQKVLAQGELMFKVNTALQQGTSTALNFAVGGKEALAAFTTMGTKESKAAWEQSVNRILRKQAEGIDMSAKLGKGLFKDLNKLPYAEQIATGYAWWKKWGMYVLEKMDMFATQHAFETGRIKGRNLGLDPEQAIKYGDLWADKLQVSMAAVDRPEYARTTMGRALFQFQSFTANLGATLMNDIPNMAFHEGAKQSVDMLLRTYAAISLYNEGMRDAGLPASFDAKTFIPFVSTYRFGVPGMMGAVKDFFNMTREGSFTGYSAKKLARLGLDALIPGAGQGYNIVQGANAIAKGKVEPGKEGRALLFGASAVKRGAKEQQEDTATSAVRKKLFGGVK